MTARPALLIINPKGGSTDQPVDRAVGILQRHGHTVDLRQPENPADVSGILRQDGPLASRIVLGGCDGTFSHSALPMTWRVRLA